MSGLLRPGMSAHDDDGSDLPTGAEVDRAALVSQLRRVRRWLLTAQAQSTGGRRSTIDGQIREIDDTLRRHGS